MIQMTVAVPDDLAHELRPYQDSLPDLMRLGLEQWRKNEPLQDKVSLEQLLQQLADEGKLIRPKAVKNRKPRKHRSLVRVGGQPVSEIVIEQRGIE